MVYAKKFLGEENNLNSLDEALFNSFFYTAMSKDIFIIKSKKPLPYQDTSAQHSHDSFELTIPLSHSPRLLIDNKIFTLPKRNIFPSNPGQVHGPAEAINNHRIIVLQISPQSLQEIASLFVDESINNIEFQNIPTPVDFYIENLIEMFIIESQNKQTGYEFILDNLSSLLGAKILRILRSNLDLKEKSLYNISKKDHKNALEYLHSNLNQDFSLEHLAKLVGLSKYHFIRVFKQETGKTPYQYFIDLKVQKAIELIKTNKYSITEICFICGFKDHSHFSRVFKVKTGFAPSIYKKLCI